LALRVLYSTHFQHGSTKVMPQVPQISTDNSPQSAFSVKENGLPAKDSESDQLYSWHDEVLTFAEEAEVAHSGSELG
jgi:hypothetical protein